MAHTRSLALAWISLMFVSGEAWSLNLDCSSNEVSVDLREAIIGGGDNFPLSIIRADADSNTCMAELNTLIQARQASLTFSSLIIQNSPNAVLSGFGLLIIENLSIDQNSTLVFDDFDRVVFPDTGSNSMSIYGKMSISDAAACRDSSRCIIENQSESFFLYEDAIIEPFFKLGAHRFLNYGAITVFQTSTPQAFDGLDNYGRLNISSPGQSFSLINLINRSTGSIHITGGGLDGYDLSVTMSTLGGTIELDSNASMIVSNRSLDLSQMALSNLSVSGEGLFALRGNLKIEGSLVLESPSVFECNIHEDCTKTSGDANLNSNIYVLNQCSFLGEVADPSSGDLGYHIFDRIEVNLGAVGGVSQHRCDIFGGISLVNGSEMYNRLDQLMVHNQNAFLISDRDTFAFYNLGVIAFSEGQPLAGIAWALDNRGEIQVQAPSEVFFKFPVVENIIGNESFVWSGGLSVISEGIASIYIENAQIGGRFDLNEESQLILSGEYAKINALSSPNGLITVKSETNFINLGSSTIKNLRFGEEGQDPVLDRDFLGFILSGDLTIQNTFESNIKVVMDVDPTIADALNTVFISDQASAIFRSPFLIDSGFITNYAGEAALTGEDLSALEDHSSFLKFEAGAYISISAHEDPDRLRDLTEDDPKLFNFGIIRAESHQNQTGGFENWTVQNHGLFDLVMSADQERGASVQLTGAQAWDDDGIYMITSAGGLDAPPAQLRLLQKSLVQSNIYLSGEVFVEFIESLVSDINLYGFGGTNATEGLRALSPGDEGAEGVLSFSQGLTLGDASEVTIDVFARDRYDAIHAQGDIDFNGTVEFILHDEFTPDRLLYLYIFATPGEVTYDSTRVRLVNHQGLEEQLNWRLVPHASTGPDDPNALKIAIEPVRVPDTTPPRLTRILEGAEQLDHLVLSRDPQGEVIDGLTILLAFDEAVYLQSGELVAVLDTAPHPLEITLSADNATRIDDSSSRPEHHVLHLGYTFPTDAEGQVTADELQLEGGAVDVIDLFVRGADGSALIDAEGNAFDFEAWDLDLEARLEESNLSVDTAPPRITRIMGAEGLYDVGDEVEITVEFHEAVRWRDEPGALRLLLSNRQEVSRVELRDGALVFTYTVGGGEAIEDLGVEGIILDDGALTDHTRVNLARLEGALPALEGDIDVLGRDDWRYDGGVVPREDAGVIDAEPDARRTILDAAAEADADDPNRRANGGREGEEAGSDDDSGCGCEVGGASPSGAAWAALALLSALIRRRRGA